MKTNHLASIVVALICASTNLRAEPEIKGNANELAEFLRGVPRTVNLAGEAEVKAPADRAIISVRVVTENKSLQEASRANQESRAKLVRALGEKGVPAERVLASRFSSTPKYGVFSEKAKGYRVENIVKITTHDEKEFQAVAAQVDSTPEFRHEGIEFEHSDKEGLKKRALDQALEKALAKKKNYEEKLGVKLTVRRFDEGQIAMPMPIARGRYYVGKSATSLPGLAYSSAPAEADAAEEAAPAGFDELVFKATVNVEFAVESK